MASRRSCVRHQALYRSLLVLYPRSFRDHYAEPMAQSFGDRFREVGVRAWARTTSDLIRTVPTERIEATMARQGPATRVVMLAFLVLATTVVAIGLGSGASWVLAITVALVVVSQRRMFASLPFGDRAPLRHAVVQTWWAPAAGLLGALMVAFGVGTVFEAHNWGGRIVGSGLLMAFGAAMLLGLMRRPFDRRGGNTLILLATVPPLLFFWVIVPPLLAIIVWIGVLKGGFSEDHAAPVAA